MCLGACIFLEEAHCVWSNVSVIWSCFENIENNALFGVYKNIEIDIVYEAHEQSIVLLKDFFKEKRSKKGEQVGIEQNKESLLEEKLSLKQNLSVFHNCRQLMVDHKMKVIKCSINNGITSTSK